MLHTLYIKSIPNIINFNGDTFEIYNFTLCICKTPNFQNISSWCHSLYSHSRYDKVTPNGNIYCSDTPVIHNFTFVHL